MRKKLTIIDVEKKKAYLRGYESAQTFIYKNFHLLKKQPKTKK